MKKIKALLVVVCTGVLLTACGNPSQKGVEYLEDGKYDQAIEQFEQAVDKKKNVGDAYRGIGIAKWEKKDYKGARKAFKKAVENDRIKTRVRGKDGFQVGKEALDLRYVEQLIDSEQTAALGYCMLYAQKHLLDGRRTLRQVVDALDELMERDTLAALCESRSGVAFLARPRKQEIFACLNRYRGLKM